MRGLAHPGAAGLLLPRLFPSERHRGQKKSHLQWIMRHVQAWAESFGDGFGGSCIVGWFAKACGFQVAVNDVMAFSNIRAKALIVNGGTILDERDLDTLEKPNSSGLRVAQKWYGAALGPSNSEWLDKFAANLPQLGDPVKRDVAAYACILALMKRMNFPQVTFTYDHKFAGKRYLEGFDWGVEFRRHAMDELPALLHDNRKANEACRGDVLEFVRSHQVDCLYLDPPFACSTKYAHDLAFYDKLSLLLAGRHELIDDPFNGLVPLPPHTSFSSRSSGLMGLAMIFRAAKHVPRIILSYNTTSGIHPDEIATDGVRIYGELIAKEERPAILSTTRADRPRHTKDILLVFDRR